MNLSWLPDNSALVEIVVSRYEYATLEDIKETINEIRADANSMIITFDLKEVDVPGPDKFKQIAHLISDVIEYTKHDNLLERINIKNSGVLFRFFYRPFSLALPREIREVIAFI